MVEYLEGCHVGEFTKPLSEVQKDILQRKVVETPYADIQLKLPTVPPAHTCQCNEPGCISCENFDKWYKSYIEDCDQLACKLNAHTCRSSKKSNKKKENDGPEARETKSLCLDSNGYCKARMPRELLPQTYFDAASGAIRMKKGEPWYNTWTPLLEFLIHCNTDCACLLSGTAVNAVTGYVTDYVAKMGLKTNVLFEAVLRVIRKMREMAMIEMTKKNTLVKRNSLCLL